MWGGGDLPFAAAKGFDGRRVKPRIERMSLSDSCIKRYKCVKKKKVSTKCMAESKALSPLSGVKYRNKSTV